MNENECFRATRFEPKRLSAVGGVLLGAAALLAAAPAIGQDPSQPERRSGHDAAAQDATAKLARIHAELRREVVACLRQDASELHPGKDEERDRESNEERDQQGQRPGDHAAQRRHGQIDESRLLISSIDARTLVAGAPFQGAGRTPLGGGTDGGGDGQSRPREQRAPQRQEIGMVLVTAGGQGAVARPGEGDFGGLERGTRPAGSARGTHVPPGVYSVLKDSQERSVQLQGKDGRVVATIPVDRDGQGNASQSEWGAIYMAIVHAMCPELGG